MKCFSHALKHLQTKLLLSHRMLFIPYQVEIRELTGQCSWKLGKPAVCIRIPLAAGRGVSLWKSKFPALLRSSENGA